MLYVAQAGVGIDEAFRLGFDREWHRIKTADGVEYRWRMRDDLVMQVVAGVFEDASVALGCAKRIYVNLLYLLMRSEISIGVSGCGTYETRFYVAELEDGLSEEEYHSQEVFFFWDKRRIKGNLVGPAVLWVERSIEEVEEYPHYGVEVDIQWEWEGLPDFGEIDAATFHYTRESQEILRSLVYADKAESLELKVTLFTCILEHLADDEEKDAKVCDAVDSIIASLDGIVSDKGLRQQITEHLTRYKRKGSARKVQDIAAKYARDSYARFKTRDVVSDAYSVRSAFAHGDDVSPGHHPAAEYIKFVAMDVVAKVMLERVG